MRRGNNIKRSWIFKYFFQVTEEGSFVHSFVHSFSLARSSRKWPSVSSSLTWAQGSGSGRDSKVPVPPPTPVLTLENNVCGHSAPLTA